MATEQATEETLCVNGCLRVVPSVNEDGQCAVCAAEWAEENARHERIGEAY